MENYKTRITTMFEKYRKKFEAKQYSSVRLTEYEKACGFTEESRKGSKPFTMTLGKLMEELWECSGNVLNCKNKHGIDGENPVCYFQFKSRHDTMKQSQAVNEILPMLEQSIKDGKKFILVILIDKNNISRKIPLHEGCGLQKIKNVKGYVPTKHMWISGDMAYEFFFPGYGKKVKKHLLYLLSTLKV